MLNPIPMDLIQFNQESLEEAMSLHPVYSHVTDFVHPGLFQWCHNLEMDHMDKLLFSTIYLN